MTIQITVEVSEPLGQRLQAWQSHLPEILERGLRELIAEQTGPIQDEDAIIELLTSQPTPEQVMALRPSANLQARVSELLSANKHRVLTQEEETELNKYLMLEHWVRLAKARAYTRAVNSK